MGLQGLAVAIAVAAWLETLTLVVLLERRVDGLSMRHVWVVMLKSAIVTGAGALVALGVERVLQGAWGADPGFLLLLARTSLAVGAGGLVIVAGSRALRIEELGTIVGLVVDLIRRRGRA